MTDLVPRIDTAAAAERIAPRVVPAVAAVQAVSAGAGGSSGEEEVGADHGAEARRQLMASMADYARMQARISHILDEMNGGVAQVSADIDAMASGSTVLVPPPPATTQALEMALQLARAMARKADLARAAQANLDPRTVGAIVGYAD